MTRSLKRPILGASKAPLKAATCELIAPPLGPPPVLPPSYVCADHQGDRFSGPPCPNCVNRGVAG